MFGIDISASAAKLGLDNAWKAVQSFTQGIVLPKTSGVGIKLDTDAPDFGWADLLGTIDTRGAAGGASPVWSVYRGGIYQYSFGTGAGVTEVFVNFHPGHDQLPSSPIYIHSHWSTIAAPTGDANWMFDLLYARGYARGVFEGTVGSGAAVTVGGAQTATVAYQHEIAEYLMATPGGFVPYTGVNFSIGAGSAALTASSATFLPSFIGRTVRVLGAGAAGGALDTTIGAYTSPTQVTLGVVASTTVTSAPAAFGWRVLDSDIIETDGVIIARCWRDASRAGDTLNVAPFLHFVDCHYKTTSVMGTKNRNYPFYT